MPSYCLSHAHTRGDRLWAMYQPRGEIWWCEAGHYARRTPRHVARYAFAWAAILTIVAACVPPGGNS